MRDAALVVLLVFSSSCGPSRFHGVDGGCPSATGCAEAGADPAIDAGPSSSFCPPAAVFCDDFESGFQWDTMSHGGPNSAVIDEMQHYRGSHALHGNTMPASLGDGGFQEGHASFTKYIPSQTTGTVAVRFYVLVNQVVDETDLLMIQNRAGGTRDFHLDLYRQFVLWNGPTQSMRLAELPVGQWTCVELVVDIGTAGRVRLFVGADVAAFDQPNVDTSGTFSQINLGIPWTNGHALQDLFFDDVAIGSSVLPCE